MSSIPWAPQQLDIFEAMRERARGVGRVLSAADVDYRDKLIVAIEVLADRGTVFNSDEVRELAGDPPEGTHPNVAGAVFTKLSAAGRITVVGYGCSRRVKGHGNLVRLWKGSAS